MDREQLNLKLQTFKNACLEKGYIKGDFYFDEAYPGDSSTAFIVKMTVNKQWMDSMSTRGQALDALIDVLWETTPSETRACVHVLTIFDEAEGDLIQQPLRKEAA